MIEQSVGTERHKVEATERIVKQPAHVLVQRKKWVVFVAWACTDIAPVRKRAAFFSTADLHIATALSPRDQIFQSHVELPL
jgi:hypothetical protein